MSNNINKTTIELILEYILLSLEKDKLNIEAYQHLVELVGLALAEHRG